MAELLPLGSIVSFQVIHEIKTSFWIKVDKELWERINFPTYRVKNFDPFEYINCKILWDCNWSDFYNKFDKWKNENK